LDGAVEQSASPVWGGVCSVEEVGVVIPDCRRLREFLNQDLEEIICFLCCLSIVLLKWDVTGTYVVFL
jgi:hypothetical protein